MGSLVPKAPFIDSPVGSKINRIIHILENVVPVVLERSGESDDLWRRRIGGRLAIGIIDPGKLRLDPTCGRLRQT